MRVSQKIPAIMQVDFLKQAIANDMLVVDRVLRDNLDSDVALIRNVAEHIINSGGKRLRPVLLLLAARAGGYAGTQHYTLAAIIEMIHTSTLLHDDVVDDSSQRRGKPTANEIFGNAAPVLVGDFLYSRAFQLMVSVNSMRVLRILANATNVIAAGEVMQLMNAGDTTLTEDAYIEIIRHKTAKLFEASTQLGALLANVSPEREDAYVRFGMHLGTAFQIMDDLLDYTGDGDAIGKNLGDDLAEGKMTLPLIHALAHADDADRAIIRRAIESGELADFSRLIEILTRAEALTYTQSRARVEAAHAEACLASEPDSSSRQALLQLCAFAVERSF
ncbi:MAG: polyprenyl synthetase family protein [Burkholderiales bacterium]|jgi:octaprenyl-diphosphate synthase|nr:polyprenyl synthetase family protein [Burkholderiales bacterium]